jgi:sRNA-binding carbon storage regulator CsrA
MSSNSKDKKGFLVVTIPVGEGVWIGEEVYVAINKIKSTTQVSLSIKAPKTHKVKKDKKEEK